MTYVIRKATSEDTKAISSFITERTGQDISPLYIENKIHSLHGNPDESLYVYEEENQILGTLAFRIRQSGEPSLKFSEVSVISSEETKQHRIAAEKLKEYAQMLTVKHECSGIWWLAGSEPRNSSTSLNKPVNFHETGYRFVKRFL